VLKLTTRSALLATLAAASVPYSIPPPSKPLTGRQADVAHLVSRGLSNAEIAQHLGISVSTVKNHVHAVLQKLHVERRSGLLFALAGQSASERLHNADRDAPVTD
jgi:DNA-binding NarL/FixJ family response regulator